MHNHANPVHANAIEGLRQNDGEIIGHLRYQVAEVFVLVINEPGWTMTARTTSLPYEVVDERGRRFEEIEITLTVKGPDDHTHANVDIYLGAIDDRIEDFPYDWV